MSPHNRMMPLAAHIAEECRKVKVSVEFIKEYRKSYYMGWPWNEIAGEPMERWEHELPYVTWLHELGHVAQIAEGRFIPTDHQNNPLPSECDAWQWAMRHTKIWNVATYAWMRKCLRGYWSGMHHAKPWCINGETTRIMMETLTMGKEKLEQNNYGIETEETW